MHWAPGCVSPIDRRGRRHPTSCIDVKRYWTIGLDDPDQEGWISHRQLALADAATRAMAGKSSHRWPRHAMATRPVLKPKDLAIRWTMVRMNRARRNSATRVLRERPWSGLLELATKHVLSWTLHLCFSTPDSLCYLHLLPILKHRNIPSQYFQKSYDFWKWSPELCRN